MELVKTSTLPVVVGANTKKEVESLADAIVSELMDKGSPIELAEMLSSTEYLVKKIKEDKRYTEYLQQTLLTNSGKAVTNSGTKIEACEVGTKYHYENCNDPVLADLYQQREILEAKIKDRETFAKFIPKEGADFINLETGEAYKIYPPYKTSTTSYKVTLSK